MYSNLVKEFTARISKESNQELVESFNKEIGNVGWTSARSVYLEVLRNEFLKRKIDIGIIVNETGGFNLKNKIKLEEDRVEIL